MYPNQSQNQPSTQEDKSFSMNFFNKYAKAGDKAEPSSVPQTKETHFQVKNISYNTGTGITPTTYQPTIPQPTYQPTVSQPIYQPTQPTYQPIVSQPTYQPTVTQPTYQYTIPQVNIASNQYVPQYQAPIQNQFGLSFKQKQQLLINQPSTYPTTQKPTWQNPTVIQSPKQSTGMFKKQGGGLINEKQKPISPAYQVYQAKEAQVIQPLSGKKGMKRTSSFDEKQEQQSLGHGPKQFKKSDFAIGKKLGKGQYGEVMLVIHKETGFLCGLKVMSKKQIKAQKYQNQIARQLSINFYLNHQNIAPLYGYFQDEQNVYLLVEYCTGGQLLSLLRKNTRLEDPETSPIIRQICEGLSYIHSQQIIHRDIKPENILFNFDTVKICDFGWAVFSANGMRKTISGSPLYYSPQIVMETAYDEKIDIWSIGMMTYECLLGKTPFRVYTELDLKRIVEDEIKFPQYVDVTDDAKDFILRIMKKKPEERMDMKDIMRHPFITKYLKIGKVSEQVIEELKRVIG